METDSTLLELPPASSLEGAVLYGVQDGQDRAFPTELLISGESPQPANTFYAGPSSGAAAVPLFRPLIAADIPDLSGRYITATGGYLVNPTITYPTITYGSISGATAVFGENDFRLRDSSDTTRQGRFELNIQSAGQSVVWTLPSSSTTLVGTDTADSLTNKRITTAPSVAASAPLNIPPGTGPSIPKNGDIWTTPSGMYLRVNDTTHGPFATTGSGVNAGVTSFNTRTGDVVLSSLDVRTALGYTPFNPGTSTVYTSGNFTPSNLPTQNSDFNIFKSNAVLGLGTATLNGGVSSVGSDGTGEVALFSNYSGGSVYMRPGGRSSSTGQLAVSTSSISWSGIPLVLAATDQTVSGSKTFTGTTNISTLVVGGNSLFYSVSAGVTGLRYTSSDGVHKFINLNGDTGNFEVLNGTVTIGGDRSPVWHSGNFNPDQKAPVSNPTFSGNVHATGSITASGGFGPGSDPRLKDESSLKIVDNAVDILYNLNVRKGKYHDWYNPDGKERFFIMADKAMEQAAPEAILEGAIEKDGESYNGWSADQMIALLVQSVKELKEEIVSLKEKNNELSH